MKIKAHKRAELFNPAQSKDVHHIVSKFISNKYNLPTCLVKNDLNAIALERDFHSWIHGNRLTKRQLIEVLGNEISELEKQIDDREIGWEGFTEDDYIFLAVAYLGIDEEYFQEPHKLKRKKSAL
jgi:hypothetical protein